MDVDTVEDTEIVTQPQAVPEQAARKQVTDRLTARVKRLVYDKDVVRTDLRFKPYFAFEVVLTKRVFRGEDKVTEGSIIVDALSGITRPFTTDAIETERKTVPSVSVLPVEVDESDAVVEANSRRMQVQHRERGKVEMDEEPRMVHKPIWLVELADGSVKAVDAVDGRVYGDMLLG